MNDAYREDSHEKQKRYRALLGYSAGFILSVLLTLTAYFSVTNRTLPGNSLMWLVVGLATVQLLVQLIFFLHLGRESRPRWKLIIFAFMLLTVGTIVGGSLWIMNHLNYNMMPHDMDKQLLHEEGIDHSSHGNH